MLCLTMPHVQDVSASVHLGIHWNIKFDQECLKVYLQGFNNLNVNSKAFTSENSLLIIYLHDWHIGNKGTNYGLTEHYLLLNGKEHTLKMFYTLISQIQTAKYNQNKLQGFQRSSEYSAFLQKSLWRYNTTLCEEN